MMTPVAISLRLKKQTPSAAKTIVEPLTPIYPPPGPRGPFFLDNYDGTDPVETRTSDSGHLYADAPGLQGSNFADLHVSDGTVGLDDTSSFGAAYVVITPPSADYIVEAEVHAAQETINDFLLGCRWDEATVTGYFVEVNQYLDTRVDPAVWKLDLLLWKETPTLVQTRLGEFDQALGDDWRVGIAAKGDQVTVYFNDAAVISVTDSDITQVGTIFFFMEPKNITDPKAKFNMAKLSATELT